MLSIAILDYRFHYSYTLQIPGNNVYNIYEKIFWGYPQMKKFGKFLTFLLLAGGAAAATWYFLKSQEDDADFEDYDDDINDELDDFLKKEAANSDRVDREYTPLDFPDAESQAENAKEEAGKVIGEIKDKASRLPMGRPLSTT